MKQLEEHIKETLVLDLSRRKVEDSKRRLPNCKKETKISLGMGGLVKKTAIKIVLYFETKPMEQRVRRYPVEQRSFLADHITLLVKSGSLIPNPGMVWQPAPKLVPKQALSIPYRIFTDLKPENVAANIRTWPTVNLEAELADLAGSKFLPIRISEMLTGTYLYISPDIALCAICLQKESMYRQESYTNSKTLWPTSSRKYYGASITCIKPKIIAWRFCGMGTLEEGLLKYLEFPFLKPTELNLHHVYKEMPFSNKKIKWLRWSRGCFVAVGQVKLGSHSKYGISPRSRSAQLVCTLLSMNVFIYFHNASRTEPLCRTVEIAYELVEKGEIELKMILGQKRLGAVHGAASQSLPETLKTAVKRDPLEENHIISVVKGASDKFCARVFSQTHWENTENPITRGTRAANLFKRIL